MAEINIIGAGITGLAAAVRILSRSPETKIRIYEASGRVGGRLKPLIVNEWKKDVANPHLIASANTAALTYLESIGADIKKNKVSWRTTSLNPFSLYRLFTESTQNVPYANSDKGQGIFLLYKAVTHGMSFYHAKPEDFIDLAVNFIKEKNGIIIPNRKINSIKEFPKHVPLIVCIDAYNMKRLGLLSGELKPLPIVNIHFNDCGSLKKETVLCPNFSFPCVIFVDKENISVTVSAASKLITYTDKNIIRIFGNLLQSLYDEKDFSRAMVFKNIRATVKVTGKRMTCPDNVIVGGDFMNDKLPPTIESAIVAGNKAADEALDLL